MNFHPLLVHFPVALLTIYALLELAGLSRLGKLSYWFYLKAMFLIIGSLASIPAAIAGLAIKPLFGGAPEVVNLVNTHENFAIATIVVFCVLAFSYVLTWIRRDAPSVRLGALEQLVQLTQKPPVIVSLAIVGLILVTITGALGGSISYGPNVDPVVSLIYKLLIH
jgi:uncharacterized membrane protein